MIAVACNNSKAHLKSTSPIPHPLKTYTTLLCPHVMPRLCTILLPLPTKEPQPSVHRLECDLAALRKEKHISLPSLDRLPTLIRDLKVSLHDNLHLIVRVLVFEGCTWIEAVEARADWLFRVNILTVIISQLGLLLSTASDARALAREMMALYVRCEDIREERVLVRDEREGFDEFCLRVTVVRELEWFHWCHCRFFGFWCSGRGRSFLFQRAVD